MKYVRPDVYVERFQLSEKIANQTCTDGSFTADAQNIDCIINGSEWIFTSGTSGCQNVVNADSDELVYYDGNGGYYYTVPNGYGPSQTTTRVYFEAGWYYVWYDGLVSGQPSDGATSFLNYLVDKANGTTGQSGWHAGPATATIIEAVSRS